MAEITVLLMALNPAGNTSASLTQGLPDLQHQLKGPEERERTKTPRHADSESYGRDSEQDQADLMLGGTFSGRGGRGELDLSSVTICQYDLSLTFVHVSDIFNLSL